MAKHEGMPRGVKTSVTKSDLIGLLARLDGDSKACKRVLAMETDFRQRITTHVESLPATDAIFAKFNTNPFVLLIHALNRKYEHVAQLENDILPAKMFSSMETSAGRMIEQVVLPIYGWEYAPSEMHSSESVIDGKQFKDGALRLATLKSGPRCLNDEMSNDIADAIISNAPQWAKSVGVKSVDVTYGVLYGTKSMSNKKDWHILRRIRERTAIKDMIEPPTDSWHCNFKIKGVRVNVAIRIGVELWNHFSDNDLAFVEMACAMVRACVAPSSSAMPRSHKFTIRDLEEIISLDPRASA